MTQDQFDHLMARYNVAHAMYEQFNSKLYSPEQYKDIGGSENVIRRLCNEYRDEVREIRTELEAELVKK